MKFGLEQHVIDNIISVLEKYSKLDKAFVFGSRAKGNYRPDSDIDIAIKGNQITTDDIISISVAIENQVMVNKIDLLDYDSIKEPELKDHIDRVGIEFYSRWKEYKIADIISLEYGKSLLNYRNGTGKYDVFGTNGKIGTSDEFLFDKPSVIIGRKGAYREVHLSKKPFFVIDTAFYTKNKVNDLDTSFLYYWFKNIDINEMDSGSAIPSTSRDEVYDVDIKLPPLSEQIAISSILGSLDDKIDLLHRQNKTLEQLSETLFRQWFVEEAEDSWEMGKLGDVLKSIESGSRPKGGIDPDLKEGIPSIGAENINGLGVYDFSKTKFITYDYFKSMNRGLIRNYDVLIYKDGAYVGRKGMFANGFPYETCVVNEHVFILRANNEVNQFFLYFLLKENELAQLNANSAQPGLNQEALKSFEIIIPPKELTNQFEDKVKNIIDKIFFNCSQIRKLIKLRDTLLPKLISGEVRVKLD